METPQATELASTLDWHDYADPATFRRELEACFADAWHYVGHAARLPEPGSQLAARALDVPVLLVRDVDEPASIRAFVNACRHRGARLVDDMSCARSIRCRYHGWTYALDGTLRGAPRLQDESRRTPAEHSASLSLHALRLETWGPMLFVSLDPEAPPLERWLGSVPARIAALGVDVDSLELRRTSAGETACNWKVACENYLECYHCRIAHRGFCDVVDVGDDAYVLEAEGNVASQTAPRRDIVLGPAPGGYDGAGPIANGSFHYVFPNLMAYVAPGEPNLVIGPVVPTAVDCTWRSLDYLAPPSVPDEAIDALVAWDDQVGEEDRVLVEAVQAGMSASRIIERGVLMPQSEQLVAWFAGRVRARTG